MATLELTSQLQNESLEAQKEGTEPDRDETAMSGEELGTRRKDKEDRQGRRITEGTPEGQAGEPCCGRRTCHPLPHLADERELTSPDVVNHPARRGKTAANASEQPTAVRLFRLGCEFWI